MKPKKNFNGIKALAKQVRLLHYSLMAGGIALLVASALLANKATSSASLLLPLIAIACLFASITSVYILWRCPYCGKRLRTSTRGLALHSTAACPHCGRNLQ